MIRQLFTLLFLLLLAGCATLPGGGAKLGGDRYTVSPPEYRAQVEAQRLRAEAELQAIGHKPRHRIARVEIRPGTIRRPKGWAIPHSASPTGYAGGMCESGLIWVVRDPKTGAVPDSAIRHEWKHAILNANGFPGNLDAQHAEIHRSEKGSRK